MVSADHFDRVRTVIDHDTGGTEVSAEVFHADEDTAFPLLTAMGVELTQTLFVGPHVLLLEGPSDLIYMDVLSDLAESHQMAGLDPRWVKTPIGGAGKLSTFVTLLVANKLDVAVLVDSSTKDTGAVRKLRDNGQLARNGLVEIGEFTGSGDADIEDLFERGFYLELVSRAYAAELSQPLTPADLASGDPRIVRVSSRSTSGSTASPAGSSATTGLPPSYSASRPAWHPASPTRRSPVPPGCSPG